MAGGVINTGSHPKLLWPGIHATWGQIYNEHGEEYIHLFDILDSQKAYEQDYQVVGFGLAQVKGQGMPGYFDSEIGGIVTTYNHIAYSLGFIVTKEEEDDNLYKEVAQRRLKRNAISMKQTVENIAANVYNNAFTNSAPYLGGDGQPMISASHPFVTGGTGSNALTPAADISEAAIEDLTIQIMQATDDRGLKFAFMPRSIHIPPQQWYNTNRILKSVLQSDTANNNLNILRAENAFPEGIKMNHYFTDPDAWFIRTNCPNGPQLFWRNRPDLKMDNDFDTYNHKYLAYMRLSVGWSDWRGVYGSAGN